MGSLYKALARNNFLKPLGDAVSEYIRRKQQEENIGKYLEQMRNTQSDIQNVFDKGIVRGTNAPYETKEPTKLQQLVPKENEPPQIPIEEPTYDVLGDYTSTPTQMNDANRLAGRKMLDFMNQTLDLKDVPPETQQKAMTLMQSLIQNEQLPKPEYYTLNEGQQKRRINTTTGEDELVAENQKDFADRKSNIYERVETFKVEGKPIKMGLRKDNGEWEPLGEAYYKKGKGDGNGGGGSGDNGYNYSNLYSNVQEGVKKIKKFKETELKKKDDGSYEYFDPATNKYQEVANQDEFNKIKEERKSKYMNDAVELVNQMGLDAPTENTAIKNIREQIGKGYTPEEAIDEFEKNNPDFPKDAIEIMKVYFELATL